MTAATGPAATARLGAVAAEEVAPEEVALDEVALEEVAAVVVLVRGAVRDAVPGGGGPPGILREAAERLGLRVPGRLRRTASGRPYLVHPDGARWEVDFNVSHSGELTGVALGLGGSYGLDVQETPRPGWERIARRWLHPEEWARVAALPAAAGRAEFTRLWAVREARCKATGAGLAGFRSPGAIGPGGAGRLDGVCWRGLPAPAGYAGALARTGPSGPGWLARPVVVRQEDGWTR